MKNCGSVLSNQLAALYGDTEKVDMIKCQQCFSHTSGFSLTVKVIILLEKHVYWRQIEIGTTSPPAGLSTTGLPDCHPLHACHSTGMPLQTKTIRSDKRLNI